MANIKEAMKILAFVEHNNDNTQVLHKNKGELGLTFWGMYQTAHPTLKIWNTINQYLKIEPDFKKLGQALVNNNEIMKDVEDFYKIHFWDKMKLDLVTNEHKQLELLCFAYNVGIKPAIKVLQETLGITINGIIEQQTINSLNGFNESLFDKLFDLEEKEYYDELIEDKTRFKIYKNGWHSRADYI